MLGSGLAQKAAIRRRQISTIWNAQTGQWRPFSRLLILAGNVFTMTGR